MPLEYLGFVLGTSFASGLNLYATVAVAGLLQRFQIAALPPGLDVLAHPLVLGLALALFVVEFLADKIPWVDTGWDAIHTFIRPLAASVLAFSAVGGVSEPWSIAAALLAGSVALTSHGAKASTRAAANTSPEPVSNWLLSLAEDAVAIALTWMAATHPILTAAIVVVLLVVAVWVIRTFYRYLTRLRARIGSMLGRTSAAAQPSSGPLDEP